MAWGARRGVDDLVARVRAGDPGLTSLTVLRGRAFGDAECGALAAALRGNAALTELTAFGHHVGPGALAELAAAVPHSALTTLSVGDGGLGDAGAAALAPAAPALAALDLEARGVGAEGARALADALVAAGDGSALRALQLARNPLGDGGAAALCAAGGAALASLTDLDVSSCGVGGDGAAHIGRALRAAPALRALGVAGLGPLPQAAAHELAAGVRAAEALRELRVDGSELDDGAAATLAAACTRITRLSLRGVAGVGAGTCAALAPVLSAGRLAALDLRGCANVGDAGACALVASGPRGVEELELGECGLGATGALAVLGAAGGVKTLGLFNAKLGDAAEKLAEALQGAASLETLDVGAAGIGVDGLKAVFGALAAGAAPALRTLMVGANPGVAEPDAVAEVAAPLREARPEVDLAWRANDPGEHQC